MSDGLNRCDKDGDFWLINHVCNGLLKEIELVSSAKELNIPKNVFHSL